MKLVLLSKTSQLPRRVKFNGSREFYLLQAFISACICTWNLPCLHTDFWWWPFLFVWFDSIWNSRRRRECSLSSSLFFSSFSVKDGDFLCKKRSFVLAIKLRLTKLHVLVSIRRPGCELRFPALFTKYERILKTLLRIFIIVSTLKPFRYRYSAARVEWQTLSIWRIPWLCYGNLQLSLYEQK